MKTVTTRSRPRSSTVGYYTNPRRSREANARLLERKPRRMNDEDARERYRREKYGQLGPVDAWLIARLSQNHAQSQSQILESQSSNSSTPSLARLGPRQGCEASADELRCTVQVECIETPSNGSGFDDPDKYVLHLSTTTAGAAQRLNLGLEVEGNDAFGASKVELGEFVGEPENMEAPEWMRWLPTGQPVGFRASAAAVADILQRTASQKESMAPLLKSLGAVTLDG